MFIKRCNNDIENSNNYHQECRKIVLVYQENRTMYQELIS